MRDRKAGDRGYQRERVRAEGRRRGGGGGRECGKKSRQGGGSECRQERLGELDCLSVPGRCPQRVD